MEKIKIALIQLLPSASKPQNLHKTSELVRQAASNGAYIVVLPECFNSPYGTQHFKKYGETIPGETSTFLSQLAKDTKTLLIGGSFPEVENEKYYNTCLVYDRKGTLLANHRKLHLFDIDIPNKITFRESKVLSPGNSITMVDTEFGMIGIGICYDIRFPEMAMICARKGCKMMIYPGAFNLTTGPLHWELLGRARAVDNQIFVAMCSPARDSEGDGYKAWGHSMLIAPDGVVQSEGGFEEEIIYGEVDWIQVETFRESIPVTKQRRFDVYRDVAE